jgi:hypothetical protein
MDGDIRVGLSEALGNRLRQLDHEGLFRVGVTEVGVGVDSQTGLHTWNPVSDLIVRTEIAAISAPARLKPLSSPPPPPPPELLSSPRPFCFDGYFINVRPSLASRGCDRIRGAAAERQGGKEHTQSDMADSGGGGMCGMCATRVPQPPPGEAPHSHPAMRRLCFVERA